MSIQEIEEQIIEEFNSFDDWMDKYNYLIEMGKAVPPIEEAQKTPSNLIVGCQSRVWLHADFEDGLVHFTADSDAVITKGIAWLLIRVLDMQKPIDIIQAEMGFLNEIGLKEHLSPTRSNGLVSMLKQMKFYAMAFQAKSNA